MKSFESAIGEILNFTKKTSDDIKHLQTNISQANFMSSQQHLSNMQKTHHAMNESTHPRWLDDTVNYKSKDSHMFNIMNSSNKLHKKATKREPSHASMVVSEQNPSRWEPNSSLCLNGSLNGFESSPLHDEVVMKAVPQVDKLRNNRAYRTTNAGTDYADVLDNRRKHSSFIHSNLNNCSMNNHEEENIWEMEIELLTKKLSYYKSQLDNFNSSDNEKWSQMIQKIEKQLTLKIQELALKRKEKMSTESVADNSIIYHTTNAQGIDLSSIEERKDHINNQMNQLSTLHEPTIDEVDDCDLSDEFADSRYSISTIRSTVTIPNEYGEKPQGVNRSVKLAHMMSHHQMQETHVIDFGKSPEKCTERDTQFIGDRRSRSPEFTYLKDKNKYKELKQSVKFSPKNCFNRYK